MKEVRLHIDDRFRVCLSAFLSKRSDISSLKAYQEGDRIILEPMSEIPTRELWVYQNKEVLAAFERGLDDSAAGRVRELDINELNLDDE